MRILYLLCLVPPILAIGLVACDIDAPWVPSPGHADPRAVSTGLEPERDGPGILSSAV